MPSCLVRMTQLSNPIPTVPSPDGDESPGQRNTHVCTDNFCRSEALISYPPRVSLASSSVCERKKEWNNLWLLHIMPVNDYHRKQPSGADLTITIWSLLSSLPLKSFEYIYIYRFSVPPFNTNLDAHYTYLLLGDFTSSSFQLLGSNITVSDIHIMCTINIVFTWVYCVSLKLLSRPCSDGSNWVYCK